jgi:hypothetical protein
MPSPITKAAPVPTEMITVGDCGVSEFVIERPTFSTQR